MSDEDLFELHVLVRSLSLHGPGTCNVDSHPSLITVEHPVIQIQAGRPYRWSRASETYQLPSVRLSCSFIANNLVFLSTNKSSFSLFVSVYLK